MTLWAQIACRQEWLQLMGVYYAEKCQREIRYMFASWIEDKIMAEKQIMENDSSFDQAAINFFEGLQNEMRSLPVADVMLKMHMEEILKIINQYSPVEFYRHLRNGIKKELELINTYKDSNFGYDDQIGAMIQELHQSISYCNPEVHKFRMDCENLHLQFNDYNRREGLAMNMNAQQKEAQFALKSKLEEDYIKINSHKGVLTANFKNIIAKYDEVQRIVIDTELKNWQRGQALAGNGAPFKDNLDEIQAWIEKLVEIICNLRNQINSMLTIITQSTFSFNDSSELTELFQHVKHEQERLILSAFIVEKQPPQVMKTNTRFTATVRWLIGHQLGISMTSPKVECIILSEAQAQRHCAQRQMSDSTPHSSGEILNNCSDMEYQQQTRHFSASFRNMQLKRIKRAEKKGTESVMDEKFTLLFYTTSVVNDYRIRAWTLSLPVVVIVHGNQEPQSWATITWDNAFSEINREPFKVPDQVTWSQLSYALNTKFCSSTGRALSEENMQFLCEKIFRGDVLGDHKEYITWAQFCKEPLPDRTFTFWDWFFAIMKLTREHLSGPWREGRIIGFINKRKTTDEILNQCPEGTFLLRFSDSELGGITIAWVDERSQVFMLQPWTSKDLGVRSLADRIQDLQHLRFLYPNINKDEAFQKFYSPVTEESRGINGYVRNIIRAHVPGITPTYSYPTTPQHNMQSPDPSREMPSITGGDALFPDNTGIDFDFL